MNLSAVSHVGKALSTRRTRKLKYHDICSVTLTPEYGVCSIVSNYLAMMHPLRQFGHFLHPADSLNDNLCLPISMHAES